MLEYLNHLWVLGTEYNRVVVPARQAAQAYGTGTLESILGLLKSLKFRARGSAELIMLRG
jgi:hypothetical protein